MGKGADRNKLCECGSGRKKKNCTCKLNIINKVFPQGTLFKTEQGMFKVLGVISDKDYPELNKLDSEKRWYAPFCSMQQIEKIFNPQNRQDILLKKQVDSVLDNMRIKRVFYRRYNISTNWNIEEQFDQTIFKLFQSILEGTDYFENFENIPCGTTYDSDANGQCIKTLYGNIITISASLKDFLYYMNIFYYGLEKKTFPDNVIYSARCIALRVMLCNEALDFELDPRGEVPNEIEIEIESKTTWELLFVVAHEFAHSILGHLEDKNVIRCITEKETIVIYNQSQMQEFEADIKAIEILGKVIGIEKAAEMAVSFFMSLDLFEQAKEQISPSISFYKTHPSAIERICNISEWLEGDIEKNQKYIELNSKIKQELMEDISINFDRYEFYGSVYLGEWHKKQLKDRIDY